MVRLSGWIADIWIREEAGPAIELARVRAPSILNLLFCDVDFFK